MEMLSLAPNLMVEDVNHTIAFYTEKLGFTLLAQNPEEGYAEWAMLQCGQAVIMFQSRDSMVDEYPDLAHSSIADGVNLFIKVDEDIDLYYDILKENEVDIAKELNTDAGNLAEFAITDVNGYLIIFAQQI